MYAVMLLPVRRVGRWRVLRGGTRATQRSGGADAACAVAVQAATALLAFKASGGAATATALASWQPGTDPCGVPKWAGVTCSGGAAPAVTELRLAGYYDVAGQIGTLAPLAADLTILGLLYTAAAGDVAGLAPLVCSHLRGKFFTSYYRVLPMRWHVRYRVPIYMGKY